MTTEVLYHKVFKHSDPNADWVTMVHGAGGSSNIWYKQLRDFRKHFHILLLDLRGHGNSKNPFQNWMQREGYQFSDICDDVIKLLDFLKIEKSHFVGISLGTIIIREISEKYPGRVQKMVLGGAVIRFNLRSRILVRLAHALKRILPFIWIYKIYAHILMPKKRHEKSRNLFINEARKIYQKEFLRWIKITSQIKPLMKLFRENPPKHPTLYLMGDEDYMFLPSVQIIASQHKNSHLEIVPKSGHVCNVDQPEFFNEKAIQFLKGLNLY
ncbi:MAG: alpha/beta fold hydrolase [Thermaurantimonas sp.]|uniref:alpha/beta fold hydrolase n=1 Tax=Thermaurantimonas sp. TaxID=2681568 RepID=UPI00391D0415